MSVELAILLANAAATWLMCGVIWFVQLVHYPLFARYDREGFRAAMAEHQAFTGRVLAPPMLVELTTSLLLLVARPDAVPVWAAWVGAALAGVWGSSTVGLQIPIHNRLAAGGFDATLHRRLVRSNWIRTAAWSLRAVLCGWMVSLTVRS